MTQRVAMYCRVGSPEQLVNNNVAIYSRVNVSPDSDGGRYGMLVQQTACREFVDEHFKEANVTIYEEYSPVFGNSIKQRPLLAKLMNDIESQKINCVVVHRIDRLSRDIIQIDTLLDFFGSHDVTVFEAISQKEYDSKSVSNILLQNIRDLEIKRAHRKKK